MCIQESCNFLGLKGIEMGQGLHTKMIQVASKVLDISSDKIHTGSTNTDIVPNTSPTAASTGSDINGMAVLVREELLFDTRILIIF